MLLFFFLTFIKSSFLDFLFAFLEEGACSGLRDNHRMVTTAMSGLLDTVQINVPAPLRPFSGSVKSTAEWISPDRMDNHETTVREKARKKIIFFRAFSRVSLWPIYSPFVNSTPVASNETSVTLPSAFRFSNFAPSSLIK